MSEASEPSGADGPARTDIEALLSEDRSFPPPEKFATRANVNDRSLHDEAAADVEAFWARQAEALDWSRRWDTVLEWDLPFARWFVGGTLNVSYNCVDRHVAAGRGDKVAFHWEGEPGDTRTITYADLLDQVQRFANVLRGLGVKRGDRPAPARPGRAGGGRPALVPPPSVLEAEPRLRGAGPAEHRVRKRQPPVGRNGWSGGNRSPKRATSLAATSGGNG